MYYAADYREMARTALKGKWGTAVLTTFVASLLGGIEISRKSGFRVNENIADQGISIQTTGGSIMLDNILPYSFMNFLHLAAGVLIVYVFVTFAIGAAVELGLNQFYIRMAYGDSPSIGVLFEKFRYIGKALALRLVTTIFIILWSLLFIIPGIIAAYRYSMAAYVLAENPEYGIMEAIYTSSDMMEGNKWRLFCLQFSFIGWNLLASLTFGIGFLFVTPYRIAAETSFYLDVSRADGYDNRDGQFVSVETWKGRDY